MDLARRIHRLLNQEGYTVRGVQKVLRDKVDGAAMEEPVQPAPAPAAYAAPALDISALRRIRDRLSQALEA